jgi:hypothetical protein
LPTDLHLMDALDASILSFEQQPLDTLRIALENEPAFMESSMPKDDHTLTYVPFIRSLFPTPGRFLYTRLHRRFLKARGYNASQAKQMILDCVHWRQTVEDVGIEELYRRIDPYDVRRTDSPPTRFRLFRNSSDLRQFPGREDVFESWPMGFHKVRNCFYSAGTRARRSTGV